MKTSTILSLTLAAATLSRMAAATVRLIRPTGQARRSRTWPTW